MEFGSQTLHYTLYSTEPPTRDRLAQERKEANVSALFGMIIFYGR